MRILQYIFAILSLVPISTLGATFALVAEPGQFNAKTLGPHSQNFSFTASVRLTEFRGTNAWPSGAYMGFHESDDRSNSVQFILMRNKATDTQLAAGYRIVKNGKELDAQFIEWLPLESRVNVTFSFAKGTVKLTVGGAEPIVIQTPLRKVAPYASVSSGGANFEVALTPQSTPAR